MQDTQNTPKGLLERAFAEYKGKMEAGDIDKIAEKLKGVCSKRTVSEYVRGNVMSVETGKQIYAELRAIMLERERSVRELVTA